MRIAREKKEKERDRERKKREEIPRDFVRAAARLRARERASYETDLFIRRLFITQAARPCFTINTLASWRHY